MTFLMSKASAESERLGLSGKWRHFCSDVRKRAFRFKVGSSTRKTSPRIAVIRMRRSNASPVAKFISSIQQPERRLVLMSECEQIFAGRPTDSRLLLDLPDYNGRGPTHADKCAGRQYGICVRHTVRLVSLSARMGAEISAIPCRPNRSP